MYTQVYAVYLGLPSVISVGV